ncbi:protein O-mannosyl-transferase family [Paraflavitalea pollutisoli]|uniref:protein O-mannosyl-transferase family n=1 Tax=Paraflavitalea pollutisoli TaxID=3034143 RepID=UPI0023ED4514|nr:DUF2723 domain-containing protein [Paraflavitalea sp. H1-2-19X]
MNFSRVNNIVGWLVCLVACTVYVLTMEPTGSFWDCGEFVSSAYKLQIPHPPGAPLFVLLGRFFIVLFGDDPKNAAMGVNFMNAIASGFTILFLFWSITHFARKLVQKTVGEALTGPQTFNVMAAGVVGALAYTFSDSFWYSAVEGEVYALSSLFTAIVFWAILKWEHEVDRESTTDGHKFSGADRWIVFIFFMMGLSIGVHLLNLLTIPAIVMVYYFKRYKVTTWGTIWAFLIGCVITGLVQVVIIQWSIKGAGAFDILFVNTFGMPFFSGFAIYFVLLTFLLVYGLRFDDAKIKKFTLFPVWLSAIILLFCFPFIKSAGSFVLLLLGLAGVIYLCYSFKSGVSSFLKIGIWASVFVIIGYSTYFTTLIRSSANPSVDMYNVDNPVSLVGYLSREQYGDWPILYGPYFTDKPTQENFVTTGDRYAKGKDKYEIVGKNGGIDYGSMPTAHLFPRMWDPNGERQQDQVYRNFGGVDGDEPTRGNEIAYFFNYQFRWMYWRYFMWNFAGKQNDLQGFGNARDGNWNSGINAVDKMFGHGTPDVLPETAGSKNKANNKLFFLPFLLGIAGLVYQYRNRRDWLVTFLLFFFTGFAIVIYLNQAGYQPRERDYAYVGSFYAFAIWIGLGVLWLNDLLAKYLKGPAAGYLAFGVTLLAVPVLMASQEWDDHDRGKKLLARDLGKDYLESCDKNAILISFGDNDTYPLWYTQEVENVRPDLRVVNYSLLGTDWYINQLRYKLNESAPADVILSAEQIQGGKRDRIYYYPLPGYNQTDYYDLYTIFKDVVASEDPSKMAPMEGGDDEDRPSVFPVKKFKVPVDVEKMKKELILNPGDSIVSELKLDINRNSLDKNDIAILALIAANKWQRPIYFTSTQELENLGLEKYTRMEGMSYRLVPIENPNNVAARKMYDVVMNKFVYGGANRPGVYYDEENRRHVNSIRQAHALLGITLNNLNMKDSAKKVLQRYDANVLEENVPYGMTSNRGNFHNRVSMSFLLAAYESGDMTLADKVNKSMKRDLEQQMRYYKSLGDDMSNEELAMQAAALLNNRGHRLAPHQDYFAQDILSSYQMLMQLGEWEKQFKGGKQPGTATENAPTDVSTDSGNAPKDTNK